MNAKKLIFTFLVSYYANFFYAQTTQEVVYFCDTKVGSAKTYGGLNTLVFNETKSLYTHDDSPDKEEMFEKGNAVIFSAYDPEKFPVYMDYSSNLLLYKVPETLKNYLIKEVIPSIKWTIGTEKKKILNYECQNAVGIFGDREYEAWFTLDMPVPMGPFKLNGLPGLILEAKSKDGIVKYTALSINKNSKKNVNVSRKDETITWDAYEKMQIDDLLKTEAMGGTNNDAPINSNIENKKFNIITEYKKKRANQKK
jgi:GLPGLI family protein